MNLKRINMAAGLIICLTLGASAQVSGESVHKAFPVANPVPSVLAAPAFGGEGISGGGGVGSMPPFAITWDTIDGGGAAVGAGNFLLHGTCGQPDPAVMSGGTFAMTGGYWFGQPAGPCYPDCDLDSVLSISDFICFQTAFALGDMYADCDGDLVLSVDDFICFQTYFAVGC